MLNRQWFPLFYHQLIFHEYLFIIMLKYTPNTLKKIEDLLKEIGYQLRSGKGSFNTGYCILESKKVIVVNNFHSIEAKINALIEILHTLSVNTEELSDEGEKAYLQFMGKDTRN